MTSTCQEGRPHSLAWVGMGWCAVKAAALLLCACSPAVLPSSAGSAAQAAAVGGAAPAAARPVEPRRVVLSYQAPASCPGYDSYAGHVRDRSATLIVDPSPLAQPTPDRVQIRIVPNGGPGWIGQLSISGPAALEREIRGERCQDVVAALALITVLRLEGDTNAATESPAPLPLEAGDGAAAALATPRLPSSEKKAETELGSSRRAGTENAPSELTPAGPDESATPATGLAPPSSLPESSEPSPVAAGPSSDAPVLAVPASPLLPDDVASVSEPVAPVVADERPVSEHRDSTEETEPPDSAQAPLQTLLVAYAGYASVPSNAFKAALQAELRFGQTVASWVGALGLAYTHGSESGPSGSAALTLFTAELALCPPGAGLEPRIWLQACAHVRAGALALSLAADESALATEDVVRPWAALGPSLQLGIPLSRSWSLRTRAELALQLVRDSFEGERAEIDANGEPERFTLYRPEAVSFELALGLAHAF